MDFPPLTFRHRNQILTNPYWQFGQTYNLNKDNDGLAKYLVDQINRWPVDSTKNLLKNEKSLRSIWNRLIINHPQYVD